MYKRGIERNDLGAEGQKGFGALIGVNAQEKCEKEGPFHEVRCSRRRRQQGRERKKCMEKGKHINA